MPHGTSQEEKALGIARQRPGAARRDLAHGPRHAHACEGRQNSPGGAEGQAAGLGRMLELEPVEWRVKGAAHLSISKVDGKFVCNYHRTHLFATIDP